MTLSAAWRSRILPTSVEPVKLILRAIAAARPGPTTLAALEVVTTFRTPSGRPASRKICTERQRRQRCQLRGLEDHGAAGSNCRRDLPGAHGQREVPRGDQHAGPDRFLGDQDPGVAVNGGGVVSADPDGLFGEPAEHLGAVGHLTLCFGEGLAHLGGHDGGQPVGVGDDEVEGAAQDVGAFAGSGLAPRRLRAAGGLDGRAASSGPPSATWAMTSWVAGFSTGKVAPLAAFCQRRR